jgi:hypothetical protein
MLLACNTNRARPSIDCYLLLKLAHNLKIFDNHLIKCWASFSLHLNCCTSIYLEAIGQLLNSLPI